ncbi:MAG: putative bifunctional diguanylate cyclase/phosphodiesterase [Actinomycetes bacterium]
MFALDVSDAASTAAFCLLALLTVVALAWGPRLHAVRDRRPWRLIAAACVAFAVGAALRPVALDLPGGQQALADAFTVPGYVLTTVGLVLLARPRRRTVDVHAVTDGLMVTVSAAMLAVTFLAVPAATVPGRPLWLTVLAALYPVLDVVLVMLLVYLVFTRRAASRSFVLLALAMGALLAGDLGYAVVGREGVLIAPHAVDVLFAVSYLCLGAAALDPSVRSFESAPARSVQAWSPGRLVLLACAFSVPPVVLLVGTPSLPARATLSLGSALILGLILLRSTSAVRRFSESQRVFRHQATHDSLTGLPNRTAVVEQLAELLAGPRAAEVQVLFLDLDGFKLVNDSWGHDVGDELLVAAAVRLRSCVPADGLVARAGGDEFLVVLASPDRCAGTRVAERVLRSLDEPFRLSASEVVVSASVGVASSGAAGSTPEALIRDADTAMYRAKAAGRHQVVVFEAAMREAVRSRVELELALRHAVGAGQLHLHYQPVVRLGDGHVVAVEALLRWRHPVLGDVAPGAFIPLAEETGLIVEIGDRVMHEGLRQLASWREARPWHRLALSVNVSARQLREPGFAQRVRDLLAECELEAGLLCLEVTESVVVDDAPHVAENLAGLHADGVRLSIDDFGTGYSSLSYLRRLPVSEVKVDRSFVSGLGGDDGDAEIIRATVAMAHALGLEVVAEGVEKPQQADRLVALGVDRAQGYLFGRPAPADEVLAPAGAAPGVLSLAQVDDR